MSGTTLIERHDISAEDVAYLKNLYADDFAAFGYWCLAVSLFRYRIVTRWTEPGGYKPVRAWRSFERDGREMSSLYTCAGDALRWVYDRRIRTPALLDAERYFPNASRFAARWEQLRDEALAIAGLFDRIPRFHEIMREQADISANDGRDWRMFVMKAYGHAVADNLARAPVLASILGDCPEALSATYSYLAPGKHVPKHRGPFRGILRFHLGLSMPRDAKGQLGNILWIDGIPHLLENGECLLWDDTYPHELLNMTDEVRVVLLLDVWRREMPADMAALSKAVVGGLRAICRVNPQAFAG